MNIEIFATYGQANERKIKDRVVVVIDMLRATSTMIAALANGAVKVIPVAEIDEAIAVARTLDPRDTVLAGERGGLPISGFQAGNSPLEFTRSLVRGKSVVITTSNGTAALHKVRNADVVLVAAMLNKSAVARELLRLDKDVCIVCSGTDDSFSADDIYCAGALVHALRELSAAPSVCDLGMLAENFYCSAREDRQLIAQAHHYQHLIDIGYQQDVDYCFEEDTVDFVPVYENGIVTCK
jgi:2-phosphosulfolactate phosphatase